MEWLNIDQNEWPLQLSLHWRYWMESALGHRELLSAQKVPAIRSWGLETNCQPELEMSGWILAEQGSKLQSFIPKERHMRFSDIWTLWAEGIWLLHSFEMQTRKLIAVQWKAKQIWSTSKQGRSPCRMCKEGQCAGCLVTFLRSDFISFGVELVSSFASAKSDKKCERKSSDEQGRSRWRGETVVGC